MMQAGLSIVGGMVGAQGAMQQAQAEHDSDIFNAQVDDRNRRIVADQTSMAAIDKKRENRRLRHSFRAIWGASGIDMTGSVLDVIKDTSVEQYLDVSRIKYAGRIKEVGLADDAALQRMAAENALIAGKISATAQMIQGLSGAVGAVGGMFSGGGGFGL